ncbi:DUF501 domain-containing protein [Candidatus Bipolaricaulota sp. J31]
MDRPPTARDLHVIRWQLGRPPRGVVAIARDCPHGYPQVTVNRPLIRHGTGFEVFPTLFWLTCPHLLREVGRLEARGLVKRFEERLARDAALREAYLRAHEAYRGERLSLLAADERAFLERVGARNAVETGIAGLRNPTRVKCLHAQLAHYLARGSNPIGEEVARLLPALHCSDRLCDRAAELELNP